MSLHDSIHHTKFVLMSPLQTAQWLMVLPFLMAYVFYLYAVRKSAQSRKPWPIHRTILFTLGVLSAAVTLIGPLADRSHMDFSIHMVGHLLLGMLAPLFIALSAPMSLLLRTVSTELARLLTRFLKSYVAQIWTHPVIAALLNIGGLWVLYTTELYSVMHDNIPVYIFVHFHVFLAGYLFTVSMIDIDPIPHRYSFLHRMIVFVFSLAGHGILAKYLYANPPNGIPTEQGRLGGILMYYGGDLVDAVIIFILCWHWYRATRPRNVKISTLS